MPKRVLIGRVKSDKMNKTRVVEIPRTVKHPKYKKYYRDRTTCYVHDEANESNEGDTVQIIEAAPTSKKKRWQLVKVIQKSNEVDVVAMRAARKQKEIERQEMEGGGKPAPFEAAAPAAVETEPAEAPATEVKEEPTE